MEKLGGADFLLQEAKTAIRVYYPQDVQRFDEALVRPQPNNDEEIQAMLEKLHKTEEEDLDGLSAFRDQFQSTVVICFLPQGNNRVHFDKPDSFVNRVQRIMGAWHSRGGKVRLIFL